MRYFLIQLIHVSLHLDGAELLEMYELSLNEEWPQIEIKGLGFRGSTYGCDDL